MFCNGRICLLFLAFCFESDPPAHCLIKEAIKAHGGREILEKTHSGYYVSHRGTLEQDGQLIRFANEAWYKGPDRIRHFATYTTGEGEQQTQLILACGNESKVLVNGKVQELPKAELGKIRQKHFENRVQTLFPLLNDPDLVLSITKDSRFENNAFHGIKVASKTFPDVELLFDVKSKLLSGIRTSEVDSTGRKNEMEAYFLDQKEFDGIKFPTRIIRIAPGIKIVEHVTKISLIRDLDDSRFVNP